MSGTTIGSDGGSGEQPGRRGTSLAPELDRKLVGDEPLDEIIDLTECARFHERATTSESTTRIELAINKERAISMLKCNTLRGSIGL